VCHAALPSTPPHPIGPGRFNDALPDEIQRLPKLKMVAGCAWLLGTTLAFLLLLSFAIKSNQEVEYISLEVRAFLPPPFPPPHPHYR
jgi:hypothetical protein